jgi:polar amino acid transport system permease protein
MTFYFGDLIPYAGLFLRGLGISIYVTLVGMAAGCLLGIVLYLAKTGGPRITRVLATGYIEVIRNTPLLVQLYLLYFGLPSLGLEIDPLWATLLGLTLNTAAYMAEIFRAGFSSIQLGQREAASALGLSGAQTFRHVLLVPAIRSVIPAITNQLILVFLFSSVASFISLDELMNTILDAGSQTARRFETLIIGGGLYYGTSAVFAASSRLAEKTLFRW